jgi:hypothetical protein
LGTTLGYPKNSSNVIGIEENNIYLYTAIGEPKSDRAEDIDEIIWRVDSEIAYIKLTKASTRNNLGLECDACCNDKSEAIICNGRFYHLTDRPLCGSSRLGLKNQSILITASTYNENILYSHEIVVQ